MPDYAPTPLPRRRRTYRPFVSLHSTGLPHHPVATWLALPRFIYERFAGQQLFKYLLRFGLFFQDVRSRWCLTMALWMPDRGHLLSVIVSQSIFPSILPSFLPFLQALFHACGRPLERSFSLLVSQSYSVRWSICPGFYSTDALSASPSISFFHPSTH